MPRHVGIILDGNRLGPSKSSKLASMSASDGAKEASPDLTQICAQKDDGNSL